MSNVENVATGGAENRENGGAPLMFLRELDIFGSRRPQRSEWLLHDEFYITLSKQIESSQIKGLQRVRNMWRICLDRGQCHFDGRWCQAKGKSRANLGYKPWTPRQRKYNKSTCEKHPPLG